MQMSTNDLAKYLEEVSKLEASVYKQEQCYTTAKSNLVYVKPEKAQIAPPVKQEVKKPTEPLHMPPFIKILAILAIVLGPLMFVIDGPIALGVLLIVCGLGLGGISIHFAKEEKRNISLYEQQLVKYNDDLKKADEAYKKDLTEYQKKLEKANVAYQKETEATKQAYAYANQSIEQMVAPLNETKDVLQKYYDLGIIFPKYRSLAAMCTICEYFQTGRCSELTGPDGAYNLYEAELRQNLIINRLESVIDRLDQIKDNQYLLYTELRQVKEATAYIAGTTTSLLISSKKIEANSAITAYCSEITVANTAALSMMAAFA